MNQLLTNWNRLEQWEKKTLVISCVLLFIVLFSKCNGNVAVLN